MNYETGINLDFLSGFEQIPNPQLNNHPHDNLGKSGIEIGSITTYHENKYIAAFKRCGSAQNIKHRSGISYNPLKFISNPSFRFTPAVLCHSQGSAYLDPS